MQPEKRIKLFDYEMPLAQLCSDLMYCIYEEDVLDIKTSGFDLLLAYRHLISYFYAVVSYAVTIYFFIRLYFLRSTWLLKYIYNRS